MCLKCGDFARGVFGAARAVAVLAPFLCTVG